MWKPIVQPIILSSSLSWNLSAISQNKVHIVTEQMDFCFMLPVCSYTSPIQCWGLFFPTCDVTWLINRMHVRDILVFWYFIIRNLESFTWASQVALVVKNPPDNAGDIRDEASIPELGRAPGEGHGSPLQYSCLENITSRGAWLAVVYWAAKSWTWLKQQQQHTHTHTHSLSLSLSLFLSPQQQSEVPQEALSISCDLVFPSR